MSTERVVLVTGATSGIGLGLAERYAATGARLVLTGRSPDRLEGVRSRLPDATVVAGDLSEPGDREQLAHVVSTHLGRLDVLVNNAGIQRRVGIAADDAPWPERQQEIDLLLAAPIHLVALLTPLLLASPTGQIVDVTSGGAFNPQPFAPTYSAAKAALHSYTTNLRYAFADTSVAVTELIPPAVATGLAGSGTPHGADLEEFCDAVFPALEERRGSVGFGPTDSADFVERLDAEQARFAAGATRFAVARYSA